MSQPRLVVVLRCQAKANFQSALTQEVSMHNISACIHFESCVSARRMHRNLYGRGWPPSVPPITQTLEHKVTWLVRMECSGFVIIKSPTGPNAMLGRLCFTRSINSHHLCVTVYVSRPRAPNSCVVHCLVAGPSEMAAEEVGRLPR
jgi:hypothetical protein